MPRSAPAHRSADEPPAAPSQSVRVVARYPHDTRAFTQGLIYRDGRLLESTGLYGRSTLREVELETGRVLRHRRLARRLFGEGVVAWRDTVVQLTWRAGIGLIYDAQTLQLRDTFRYDGEGWGITHDARQWIVSDGSARLRLFDPVLRRETGAIEVRDHRRPVSRLNELEYVDGEIWANIWQQDRLARIDPASGQVLGYVDLSDLWPSAQRSSKADVLNGIACDAESGRIFVTGKFWPHVYEIAPLPPGAR
ncbi:MAG: glutaminyl-peptide cyclotransferase [Thiohalocapsa sp.]|nr:glutaminyl-peptide cyclotransferase [Thiohalocapsa sp.]MCF7992101.1 glutaminyl-peptide cyclotransferase [Thiohalocapsa sp.]